MSTVSIFFVVLVVLALWSMAAPDVNVLRAVMRPPSPGKFWRRYRRRCAH